MDEVVIILVASKMRKNLIFFFSSIHDVFVSGSKWSLLVITLLTV